MRTHLVMHRGRANARHHSLQLFLEFLELLDQGVVGPSEVRLGLRELSSAGDRGQTSGAIRLEASPTPIANTRDP